MLYTTFVTFTFGFGLPALFPLAAVYFGLMYLVERYRLVYDYRKGAEVDMKIVKEVYGKATIAGCMFLAFAIWITANSRLVE